MDADDEVIDLTVKGSGKSRGSSETSEGIQQMDLPIDGIVFESVHTPVNDDSISVISNTQPVSPVVSPQKEKEKEEIVLDTTTLNETNFVPLPDFDSEMQQIGFLREVLQSVYSGILREGIRKGTEYPYIPDNFNRENTDALKHKLMTGILRLYEESRGIPEKERTTSADVVPSNGRVVASSSNASISPVDTRSTDWVEDKEEVPPPPFGLESAVIDHMLKTWTTDEHKIAYLKSWVRSLAAPAHESFPLGIQITNISRVVKDGFTVLLIPIIRRMSTVNPITVYIRQNHIPPSKSPQSAAYQKHFKLDEDDILRSAEEMGINFSESDDEDEDSDSDVDSRTSNGEFPRGAPRQRQGSSDKGDPFVTMESIVFDIRIKRVVDAETLERLTAISDVVHQYGTGAAIRARTTSGYLYSSDTHFPEIHQSRSLSYRTDSNDYSSLSEINSALQEIEKNVAREQAAIPIPYAEPEPYNENKPLNLEKIISSIPVINQWFPQPKRSTSMADLPYQRSSSLSEPLVDSQRNVPYQRSASMAEPSVRFQSAVNKVSVAPASSNSSGGSENEEKTHQQQFVSAGASVHSQSTGSSGGGSQTNSRSPSVDEPSTVKPRKGDSKIAARLEALRKK